MLHGTSPSPRTSSTGHGGSALATASACTCRPHALDASDADGVAGGRLALAEREPRRGERAPDAAARGEALAELEDRVDVALARVREQEDVDALL